jgi:hypothetical protein
MKNPYLVQALSGAILLALGACGGGGGGTAATTTTSNATASSVSSGAITAFGSVFVNGHEFDTRHAQLVDDDTGVTSTSTAALEVGMMLDVRPSKGSTRSKPMAGELHMHPLARGVVDASDLTAGTITVMGQMVQITSSTNFSDHRACATATTSTCTAVAGQSTLSATTGSGSAAVAGGYVTVHGYLFGNGSGSTNIVATLVSVSDAPTSTTAKAQYKVEGVVTAVGASSVTIGGLTVDLSGATCVVSGVVTACASAYSVGNVVSAMASAAPSLPVTTLVADRARLASKVPVEAAGSTMEIEGSVSSVNTSANAFVVRGVTVDASTLASGTSLPAVGDVVKVEGTVAASGQSVTATSLTVIHASRSTSVALEADVTSVAAGTATDTYMVQILGQSIAINGNTRLADRQTSSWSHDDPASNPFNITTFQTYLAASASQHVVIKAQVDANGLIKAQSLTIAPASTAVGLAGLVDATPAPVNSSVSGTLTTFSVQGLAVSADPAAVVQQQGGQAATLAAGDEVVVYGTYQDGVLRVGSTLSATNKVLDRGVPNRRDHDRF